MILYGILWRVQWLHLINNISSDFLNYCTTLFYIPHFLDFSQLQGTNQRLLTSFAMQSFCQFYAETCNLTDYLENCSVSFSVARRLCRLCLLPCISCISCPKDVRKFCPFIYFLPTWHPFNDNLLEIVSCFLCCLRCFSSLLFGFFFSGTFDAYLRVNCISFSNVLLFPLSFSLAPAMAIMLSVFSQQFPVKMLKSWKVHCSQMQATHSWQRDSQADRQTDRQTERETVSLPTG